MRSGRRGTCIPSSKWTAGLHILESQFTWSMVRHWQDILAAIVMRRHQEEGEMLCTNQAPMQVAFLFVAFCPSRASFPRLLSLLSGATEVPASSQSWPKIEEIITSELCSRLIWTKMSTKKVVTFSLLRDASMDVDGHRGLSGFHCLLSDPPHLTSPAVVLLFTAEVVWKLHPVDYVSPTPFLTIFWKDDGKMS